MILDKIDSFFNSKLILDKSLILLSKSVNILFLFIPIFILFTTKSAYAAEASLLFDPQAASPKVGESFSIDVLVDTAGESVGGVDAIVIFKPTSVNAVSIQTGKIFTDYPASVIDNKNGKIYISGIVASKNQLYSGRDTFATINFTALTAGSTTLSFDYQPGSTRDSNIAVTFGSGDILSKVNTSKLSIQASETGDQTITPESQVPIESSRPTSQQIDPHQPLPSQPPVTDPNQQQPLEVNQEPTFTSTKAPLSSTKKTSLIILLILVILITCFFIIFLFRRRKKLTEAPNQPQS